MYLRIRVHVHAKLLKVIINLLLLCFTSTSCKSYIHQNIVNQMKYCPEYCAAKRHSWSLKLRVMYRTPSYHYTEHSYIHAHMHNIHVHVGVHVHITV